MSQSVETVETDFLSMFKWSFDVMMGNYRVWLYPVLLSFVQGLLSTLISLYAFTFGFNLIFLYPLLSAIEFLIYLGFTVVIYFLVLMSVKMFIHVYEGVAPDFESAKEEILSSPLAYLVIGIIATIITIFVITVPIALLLIVVAVILGPSDIGRLFSIVFSILEKNLVTVILLSLAAIILEIISVSLSSISLFFSALSFILSPLSTFVDILVLGAFTFLSLKALGYDASKSSMDESIE